MISLKEILHIIGDEKKSGLIPIDDWKWPDVDHLATMGFGFDGDYYMRTEKPPRMTVYKKKDKSPSGENEENFYLEEEGEKSEKKVKVFKIFNDLIDYFDTYSQPEIDEKR